METLQLAPESRGIETAAELLRAGQLVALPTETVYGLGGDATNGRAVAGIFAAKGRPSFNPLIVHVADVAAAQALAQWSETADALAEAFWPGPLTLVLPAREDAALSDLVRAGLPSVAIRVPAHPVAQALLRAARCPIAAPSANPSGQISPTRPEHVLAGLSGAIAAVMDAGPCAVGLESTIVGLAGPPTLLRPGGLSLDRIEQVLGTPLTAAGEGISAPGQLTSHYAPDAPLRLAATKADAGEVMIGFGRVAGTLTLSAAGDLTEAAANLFSVLHSANATGRPIAVAPIPETGLGIAINDRLRRAAAPRP